MMKQRTLILLILLSLVQVTVFAQSDSYDGRHPIVVDDNEVYHVIVSGNIDVVLQKSDKVSISMKMDDKGSSKVRVKLHNGEIYISPKSSKPTEERYTVYIWSRDLQDITLTGNSFITTIGVLQFDNLTVNLKDDARIALRSAGKLNINSQKDKTVVQETQYSVVYSAGK